MNKKFLDILCDPSSKEKLKLTVRHQDGEDVISGELYSSTNVYKIINGIPRFVSDEGYSQNFGWQWNKWAKVQFDDENIGKPMENYTKNMFQTITEFNEEDLNGKLVLDIGCGSGRFTDVAIRFGATVVSVDYSSAIDVAYKNTKSQNSLFIQCDALNLPFKENVFDFAFSIGVLHHTPNPKIGVNEAYRVIKKKGKFAISVYSKESNYTLPSVKLWRFIFKKLSKLFSYFPALIYSRLFGTLNHFIGRINVKLTYPIKLFFPTVVLKDLRWSILDTFDSVTTSYQSGHTIYEVYNWFQDTGFINIRPGDWRVNLIGEK